MQYLLKDDSALQLAAKAAEHLGVPYDLRYGIYTTDPRLCAIIEALAGEAYTPAPWLENAPTILNVNKPDVQPGLTEEGLENVKRLQAEEESSLPIKPVIVRPGKAAKPKPEKRPRPMCEVCGVRPTTSNHAKICDDPKCKAERQRRYMQEANDRLRGKMIANALIDPEPAPRVAEQVLTVMRGAENDINSELEPEPNSFPAGVGEALAAEYPLPVERLERAETARQDYQAAQTDVQDEMAEKVSALGHQLSSDLTAMMPAETPTISTVNLLSAPDSWSQTEPWWILSGIQAGMTMTSKLMRNRVQNGTLEPGTRLRNIWRGDYLVQAATADHPRRVVQVGTGPGMPSQAEAGQPE